MFSNVPFFLHCSKARYFILQCLKGFTRDNHICKVTLQLKADFFFFFAHFYCNGFWTVYVVYEYELIQSRELITEQSDISTKTLYILCMEMS